MQVCGLVRGRYFTLGWNHLHTYIVSTKGARVEVLCVPLPMSIETRERGQETVNEVFLHRDTSSTYATWMTHVTIQF